MSSLKCDFPEGSEEILNFLDIMDLDESVVDEKIGKLVEKKSLSVSQLRAILVSLKYKCAICLQEGTDCDNDAYISFALKSLMKNQNEDVGNKILLKILTVSLMLNQERIQSLTEHVLQQLLASEELKAALNSECNLSISPLHIVDKILEMCLSNSVALFPLFLNNEIEILLQKQEEIMNIGFFSHTIPIVIEICNDYTILNIIWDNISKRLNSYTVQDFVVLCTLSEYYVPLTSEDAGRVRSIVKSSMIKKTDFWKMIQYGMLQDDCVMRKCCIYLVRRALLSCSESMSPVYDIISPTSIFRWNKEKNQCWNSLLVLLETLEEKQSELVLSSLKLFECLREIHVSWFYITLFRALSHNTNAVVFEAVKIALGETEVQEKFPFDKLLEALNNTYIYENFDETEVNPVRSMLKNFLENKDNLINFMKGMAKVKPSPIPKYYIYSVIQNIYLKDSENIILSEILNLFLYEDASSNNILFEFSNKCSLLDFIMNHKLVMNVKDLLCIVSALNTNNTPVDSGNVLWDKMLSLFMSCSQLSMDGSSFCSFWNDCIVLQYNNSLAIFVVLIVYSGIVNINALLSTFCEITKNNKLIFILADIFEVLCNSKECDNFRNEISVLLRKEIHSAGPYILNIIREVDPTQNYFVDHLLRSLRTFIFISDSSDLINIYYHKFMSKINTGYNTFIELSVISYIVQAVSKIICYSTSQKYQLINPLFQVITEWEFLQKQEIYHSQMVSLMNKERIIIHTENYKYMDVWDTNEIVKLYKKVLEFLDIGGNGCLVHVTSLSKILLKNISTSMAVDKIKILVDLTWKEIYVIRKSGEFMPCVKGFIQMVFQPNFLQDFNYKEMMLEYLNNIFELSNHVPIAAYELINHLCLQVSQEVILSRVLTKALMFGTPLRKDQRIEQDIVKKIKISMDNSSVSKIQKYVSDPVSHIKMIALSTLLKQPTDVHTTVINNLIERVDLLNKSNSRYHANSLHHRLLLRTLQLICISSTIHKTSECMYQYVTWCVKRLASQPHHTSSKILLEWYISLYIIYNDLSLNETNMKKINLESVPQISYFTILYHVTKHRIAKILLNNDVTNRKNTHLQQDVEQDLDFVMQTFLQYTMGQIFSIRLHVQYYVVKLLDLVKASSFYSKYTLFVDIIQKTFKVNENDKTLNKISQDFYINKVDIIESLSIANIYYSLPWLTNVAKDECISVDVLNSAEYFNAFPDASISYKILLDTPRNMITERNEKENFGSSEIVSFNENYTNIQKKFVPWRKFLSDMGINIEKEKVRSTCELIVVASLIDRLPNLGGLCRTCEVFGVQKYIIKSLTYLQDKQFQSTSMSSEKWLDINDKTPGHKLKEYILEMKNNGYSIVAAEQTSSSISLKSFNFPKKCLLLVGHEKDGIPCDLICLMDHCVEIPQHGMVRSLNVHVTASIFIWEYMKQHPLEI